MLYIADKLAALLQDSAFYEKTHIVGGAVRDHLLGKTSKDIDLVVEIQDGGIKLAEFLYAGGHCSAPVVFQRFGTAFVQMDGDKLEFVMTRSESYQPGSRKPEVQVASLMQDVYRRDFTINSLLYKISDKSILDLTGKGRDDLEAGLIRATSDPGILYQEDPLRMLRAIRFAVQLDFMIEEQTYQLIAKKASALRDISRERIRDELQLILLSDSPVRGMNLLLNSGLLELIIPELIPAVNQEQNKYHVDTVFGHTMEVVSRTEADIHLRLAALLHDIAKPLCVSEDGKGVHFYEHEKEGALIAGKILSRLKFPVKTKKLVKKLIRDHMKLKQAGKKGEKISDKGIRRLILAWEDDLDLLLDLVHADNLAHAPSYILSQQIPGFRKRIDQIKKELTKAEMPVKGKDVLETFKLKPGKQVGDYLTKSQEVWLSHPDWDKDRILQYLQFKEEEMEKESKVTQKVREGVIKAYEVGEDVVEAIGRITKEVVSTAKDEELSSKAKVDKLAHEALEGAKQGLKSAQPPTEDFVKKASKSISEAIKVSAPKVAHFAQEAFKGIYEGAKDVYTSKKQKEDKE